MGALDSDNSPQFLEVDALGHLKTSMGYAIPEHNFSIATYYDAGKTNLQTLVFKSGGSGGTVVATITITYFGDPVSTANAKFESRSIAYP